MVNLYLGIEYYFIFLIKGLQSFSFCGLTNIYNIYIEMLYDYNTEYKTKHSAMCYDTDINYTGKTWLSFNLSLVY